MSGGGTRKITGRMLTSSEKKNDKSNLKNTRRLSDLDMHKLEIELANLKSQITVKNAKIKTNF